MKNSMIRAIVIFSFFLLAAAPLYAGPLTSPDNPHNLSATSSNAVKATTETRICVFCHTPHSSTGDTPLWNRNDPSKMLAFGLYVGTLQIDEPGISATTGYSTAARDAGTYPNGASRLCLSCHDGVSAIGAVVSEGLPISMTVNTLGGRSSEILLSSSHPISFVYDDGASAVVNFLNTNKGAGWYRLPGSGVAAGDVTLDGDGRMQCTTCHDPHNDTRTAGYDLPFWAHTASGNANTDYNNTCLECHQGADWAGVWSTPSPTFPVGPGHN